MWFFIWCFLFGFQFAASFATPTFVGHAPRQKLSDPKEILKKVKKSKEAVEMPVQSLVGILHA
jgi:hypothetical protein